MEKAKFKWHRVLVCTLLTLILLSPMMTFAMEVQGETSPAMLEARTVDSQRLANFNRRKAKSDDDDSEPEPLVPLGETVTVGDRNSQITTEYAESSHKTTESESIPVFPGIVESKIIKPVLSVEGFISSQAEEPVITTPMPGIVESKDTQTPAPTTDDADDTDTLHTSLEQLLAKIEDNLTEDELKAISFLCNLTAMLISLTVRKRKIPKSIVEIAGNVLIAVVLSEIQGYVYVEMGLSVYETVVVGIGATVFSNLQDLSNWGLNAVFSKQN